MEAQRKEEAQREKEVGTYAYHKSFFETAVDHYTRGANLDPHDISFLTNRAAAYLHMGKYKDCVRDCDEAVVRGRKLRSDKKLIAKALSRKASALLQLAGCAGDYAPAIRALQQSLAEHDSKETRAKLNEAEKELEEQERLDQEAADLHREKGNENFQAKKYQEAAAHYTEASKKNPNDPRVFSNRAQCHIHLGALPEGLEDAEKCIELDPTFLKGYVCKAEVQFLMDNYENALSTYLEGLKCDPNNREVLDGLRRCAACIKRASGCHVEPEDLEEILGDFRSNDDLHNKLQKSMEEAAESKKEASDERLRRIESEQMAKKFEDKYLRQVRRGKKTEESLSRIQQELEQLKTQQDQGYFRSNDDLRNKLQKSMEEAAECKKEASDERSRRIESEQMVKKFEDKYLRQVRRGKKTEESLSRIQQELEQLKIQQHEVTEKLQKANEDNEHLQRQLSESRDLCDRLLSEHDHLPHERDHVVRSVPEENCIPSYFVCPISHDVMNDPHIAADGFTYEAEAIRTWRDTGGDTSPMTSLRLQNNELIPNRALRSAIQEWLQQQNMVL